jgi:hypothetical protein
MLSYPIDEAEELLSTKLAAAKKSLANCEEDLDFLREQITVRFWQGGKYSSFVEVVPNRELDDGGSNSTSLQLGRYYEAKREERARCSRRYSKGWYTKWLGALYQIKILMVAAKLSNLWHRIAGPRLYEPFE